MFRFVINLIMPSTKLLQLSQNDYSNASVKEIMRTRTRTKARSMARTKTQTRTRTLLS